MLSASYGIPSTTEQKVANAELKINGILAELANGYADRSQWYSTKVMQWRSSICTEDQKSTALSTRDLSRSNPHLWRLNYVAEHLGLINQRYVY